jgi:hypothetical protein
MRGMSTVVFQWGFSSPGPEACLAFFNKFREGVAAVVCPEDDVRGEVWNLG